MAAYKGVTDASDISNTDASDKIPIYYRNTESGNEMITGYLSKKKCKNPQSFFGHFKCEECGNTWTSSNTLQGCRQSCDKCSCPNWPFKVYHLEQAAKSFDTYRETNDDDDDDDDDDDNDDDNDDDDDDDDNDDDDDDVNNHNKIYDYDYDDYSSDDDDDDDDDDSKEIPIYLRIQIIGCVGEELITGYLSKERFRGKWRGKRFYGYFRCKICGNTWTSHNIWQGYKQECKKCENNVAYWPYIVYHLEQLKKKDNQKPHLWELCEKCQELGYNCRDDDTIGYRISQPNKYYGQGFKKQFDLFSHGIRLEIKFIQEFYLLVLPLLKANRDEMNEFNEALIFCINKWQVQGNSILVEEFLNILEKQFELCDTNKMLEPKFINEYYEIMWPRFSIEKKKAFKIALKSILKKCKKRKSKEMVKACRKVLKKIIAKK